MTESHRPTDRAEAIAAARARYANATPRRPRGASPRAKLNVVAMAAGSALFMVGAMAGTAASAQATSPIAAGTPQVITIQVPTVGADGIVTTELRELQVSATVPSSPRPAPAPTRGS